MFEKFLKRSSWTDIAISLVFVLLGILLVAKPVEMVSVISILLGAVFVIMAFLKIVEYFTTEPKEDYLLTIALVSMVFGVIIMFCSEAILSVFKVVLGLWIIASGIMNFQTALAWKEIKSPYWTTSVVASMLMIIAGIVILVNGTIALRTIGIITIIYAALDIVDRVIFMKKMDKVLND